MTNTKKQQQKLLEIVKEAIECDQQLRKKYHIKDRFRFVRDRLLVLSEKLEKDLKVIELKEKKILEESPTDEVIVYVYLFNVQGLDVRSWMKMLTPKIFYEHSVNRPVYLNKSHVEAVIRAKKNIVQHAYLSVAIKKGDIIQLESGKDSLGHPLAKIQESSLHFEKLITFVHNGHHYTVNEDGELIKKR